MTDGYVVTIWRSLPKCRSTRMRASFRSAAARRSIASCSTKWPNTGVAKLNTSRCKMTVRQRPNALQLRAKLHPSLLAMVERLKNKTAQPTAAKAKFVRNGKAELQIWLTEKSPAIIAELQQLGFEVILDPSSAKLLIGRLPLEKLAALAEIAAVKHVAPQQ